ncbi:(2Fe-2S)-binding protein [Stakelama sp. CBK3Z-3]|uniref:(2Fe-2S)-binding protein n=1 Tax=Stakelama flava TaxID=2860338 RepID=A0ABS6XMZ5_9SPHN|nr:(2Fe-2S)-binding protein [Stakelama flava]MBW4331580.1 (2Fe-2S)-binding protein [Stakelama flava]
MTRFTVNNQPVAYDMDPETPLLWALRDASNLTGTKYGCGTGECGACTVDIDGKAVRSCQVTIGAIEGTFVTTIEGLSRDRSHPVQQALIASNVSQCGYCIPGIVMAASALLREKHDPGETEIAEAISNLCRCGIYPRLTDAIRRAARIARGDERVEPPPRPGTDESGAARSVPAMRAGQREDVDKAD